VGRPGSAELTGHHQPQPAVSARRGHLHAGHSLGPAHHQQHPDLGHPAGRAAPGRHPRQDSRARHRQRGALAPRRPAREPVTGWRCGSS